ncbi:MAG: metallophosphoesterase [Longimicrobiales bacterium]
MTRAGHLTLLLLFLLSGCYYRIPPMDESFEEVPDRDLPPLPEGLALRVLVLGDWGTGGPGQMALARAIERVHEEAPPDLVLTVGDNFYPDGVMGLYDPLFEKIFERVYVGPFWERLVFFPTLGNHDYGGSIKDQIRYSERNPRWTLPAQFYTFQKPLPSGKAARFLALDSHNIRSRGGATERQLEFVDSVLDVADDRWIIAYGHFPMATVGLHPPNKPMLQRLAPRLEGRVPLYLAGHNHSLELLPISGTLLQAVCGGGGGRDNPYPLRNPEDAIVAFTHGGWCFLHLFDESLVIELYNRAGLLRHRHIVPHPSSSLDPGGDEEERTGLSGLVGGRLPAGEGGFAP